MTSSTLRAIGRFKVTKADKTHWTIVLAYGGLLGISLAAFLGAPSWRIAAIALLFGPTIGTILLAGFTLVQMAGRRISLACGVGAVVFLVAVSFICLVLAAPTIRST